MQQATQMASANITDVQRGATETASSHVLSAALEVAKFLASVRAA